MPRRTLPKSVARREFGYYRKHNSAEFQKRAHRVIALQKFIDFFKNSFGGYGIQPRTAIGQRSDGVIVFLVIDGRNPTWSIGCTMSDLIEVLEKYGVVNAACCDGGSSSVLAYDGEVLNKNSSVNPDYGSGWFDSSLELVETIGHHNFYK